jgi:hypothetical protein
MVIEHEGNLNFTAIFHLFRIFDINAMKPFLYLLSYYIRENVFTNENINIIHDNFINTYLWVFSAIFPFVNVRNSQTSKPWLTKYIKSLV